MTAKRLIVTSLTLALATATAWAASPRKGKPRARGFVAQVGQIIVVQADKRTYRGGGISEQDVMRRVYGVDNGEAVAAFRGDHYHTAAIYSAFPAEPKGAFAYSVNVRNTVENIGIELFDDGEAWGSGSRLRSVLQMNDLDEYPSQPDVPISESRPYHHRTLATHEFFHMVCCNLESSVGNINDGAWHWSKLLDTSGPVDSGSSVMHGADWGPDPLSVDASELPLEFTVETEPFQGFSALDRYLLGDYDDVPTDELGSWIAPRGLLDAKGVKVWEEATLGDTAVARGVAAVTIDDIIATMGGRRHETNESFFANEIPEYRVAFVLVVPASTTRDDLDALDLDEPSDQAAGPSSPLELAIAKLDLFRLDFEAAFAPPAPLEFRRLTLSTDLGPH